MTTAEPYKVAPELEAKLGVVEIGSLIVMPKNSLEHAPADVAETAASLDQHRQQTPIVVDAAGVVLKGNGTLLAARSLGWTHICAVTSELEGLAARRYSVQDNATGRNAPWAPGNVAELLEELEGAAEGPVGLGFAEVADLEAILESAPPLDLGDGGAGDGAGEGQEGGEGGGEGGGAGEGSPGGDSGEGGGSHVRLVQLFFNERTVETFRKIVDGLAEKWQTSSDTDTVLAGLRILAESNGVAFDEEEAPTA